MKNQKPSALSRFGWYLLYVVTVVFLEFTYPLLLAWEYLGLFWYRVKTGYFNDAIIVLAAIPVGVTAGLGVWEVASGKLLLGLLTLLAVAIYGRLFFKLILHRYS